jgi:hypothetical protein
MYDGSFTLENLGIDYAVVGHGVALNLGIGLTFTDQSVFMSRKKENKFR